MHIYIPVALTAVLLSSVVLAYILKKNRIFNVKVFAAVVIALSATSLSFPFVLGAIASISSFTTAWLDILIAFLGSIILFATVLFMLTILFSSAISDKKVKAINASINKSNIVEKNESFFITTGKPLKEGSPSQEELITEEIKEKPDDGKKMEDYEELSHKEANILEKSVDTERNTDKMGIETIYDTASNSLDMVFNKTGSSTADMDLSINDCIDEAFRLKELGDFEGAILYYMYALDKNPGKSVVFWIILDICVLYKLLGQAEFAKEILKSYTVNYGDIMDESVKAEIDKNLSYL